MGEPSQISMRQLGMREGGQARDVAVAIDVLRAFSAEAVAFGQGASEIIAVSRVDEAFSWRERDPGVLLMGEVMGEHVPGFDFGNSPAELASQDLRGARLIHRSSSGTQGVLGCRGARVTLVASFLVARATAQYIRGLRPAHVDFIISGREGHFVGDDDEACADYIAALLDGQQPDTQPFVNRMLDSHAGRKFLEKSSAHPWRADLEYCMQVNRYPFAMRVEWLDGNCVIRSVPIDPDPG